MRTSIFASTLWLPARREDVFPFFAEAANLERITPPWLSFRVLSPAPVVMAPGTLIDYRLRVRGVPLRWRSRITAWDPPSRFVDEQVRGPYRRWIHQHRFEEEDGGTRCFDQVEYAVPGGRLLDRLLVRPDVERIFAYRRRVLEEIFAPPRGEDR
jgi:ligand-binding SRPBCC domain-containing protein